MPETVPYIISHIQLDTYNFSVIPELESGKNICFWWLKIPLGNLYIDEVDHADFQINYLTLLYPL
jgi:hypothetical protein